MNAIDMLIEDHRYVEKLFEDFEADPGDHRPELLAAIIRELSAHAAIEEAYVYPRIRQAVPIAGPYVEESVHEHQDLKESLARLDGKVRSARTKEVADQVMTLRKKTALHVEEEETELFPAFAAVARKRELDHLGDVVKKAKGSAPTRPHPNQPPANVLTLKANGVVDRARDVVGGRPH